MPLLHVGPHSVGAAAGGGPVIQQTTIAAHERYADTEEVTDVGPINPPEVHPALTDCRYTGVCPTAELLRRELDAVR